MRAACRNPAGLVDVAGIDIVKLPNLSMPIHWDAFLENVQLVVHLAGVVHRADVTRAEYDRVITEATGELAQSCRRCGVSHLVFVSSIGAQTGPSANFTVTEDDEPQPTTYYGKAKLAAEGLVSMAGVPFTILRPAVVYGPGAKGNVAALAKIASLPLPLPFANLENRRSLVGVDNLVAAILFCLSHPATTGQTYVVADRDPLRLSDIFAILRSARGRPAALFPFPATWIENLLHAIGRDALWDRIGRNLVIDSGRLLSAGWQPPIDTLSGLREMARSDMTQARAPSR
ncbi:UDP-glucose 4-epimerase [Rhodopseudomonas palustris]|nr:UDP-glucose 4-epimerase [Rhodopseudomonas palustris]